MTNLDRTLQLYQHIRPRIERAITNSATFRDGYPAGGTGTSSGTGDRTGQTAARHLDNGDTHGQLRRDLERCVARLADLVDQLAPSNKALDHLATLASDACPPSCCQACWDTGTRTPTKNPGGVLCRWCGDTARALNMDAPPRALVDKHNRGLRITDRDVRQATGGKHGA